MSAFRLIEVVSAAGDGYGFGPLALKGPGERLTQTSVAGWIAWLQQTFGGKFAEQAGHWEHVLTQVGPWQPAQTPQMTFSRVAHQLDNGRLQVRRLPVPSASLASAYSDNSAPAAIRSQTMRSSLSSTPATTTVASPAATGPVVGAIAPDRANLQCLGDPVAPASGEEILVLDDFVVHTAMPLHWRRWYRSRYSDRDLGLGPGWYAQCLRQVWQDHEATWLMDHEARPVRLPLLQPGEIAWQPAGGQRLERKLDGRMVLTELDGRVWIMVPDGQGRWRPGSVQDVLGRQWLFHYGAGQRLLRLEFSPSKSLLFAYDKAQRLCQIDHQSDDLVQPLVSYQYDLEGNLSAATTAKGTERYQYQGGQYQGGQYQNGLLVSRELASGYRFSFLWDGTGPEARCLRSRGEDGRYDFRFDYQPDRFQTRVTDAFANEQVFHYDDQGRILARQGADGGLHQWSYDNQGQLIAYSLPDGRTTHYQFDSCRRPKVTRYPDGRRHQRQFNALGFCVAEQLPNGQSLRRRFDALGRILAERRADGSHWQYHYDANGCLSEARCDNGAFRRTGFDGEGQLRAVEKAGTLQRYSFDSLGRLRGRLSQGLVTEYEYLAGQVSAIHQYPEQTPQLRQSRIFHYDQAGRLSGFTAATGAEHRYEYDGLARPIRYQRPDGRRVDYHYDKAQRLTEVVRPDGARWRLSYNSNGQVSHCQAPDGRNIELRYDAAGDVIHRQQVHDWFQNLRRDSGGRILQLNSQGAGRAAVTRQFQYDCFGRRTGACCSDRRLGWEYDDQGRMTGHRQAQHQVRYGYGPGQRLESLLLPDGTAIRYGYDRQGRWNALTVNDLTQLQRTFDNQGREQARQGSANCQTQVWDRQNRLIKRRWQGQDSQVRRYCWDAESRLEHFEDSQQGRHQFRRDLQGQLTADNAQCFAYDDGGNRRPKESTIAQDRLANAGQTRRRYDALGAETEVGGAHPERRCFDAEGQLVEVKREGLHVQYGYDALGRRAFRHNSAGRIDYLWHNDVLLGEQRDGVWQWYIRDPATDAPLLVLIGEDIHYYELDWRQAPIRLWNAAGELTWQGNPDAWGQCQPEGVLHQPLRLPGQFEDELTGLHYNRFRDYDPQMGRYLTPDPLGIKGGLNSYRYTANPIDFIDPLGLDDCSSVTAANASAGEMAPVPDDLPDLQEVGGFVAAASATATAVSAALKATGDSVSDGIGLIISTAGGLLGEVVGAAYAFQPGIAREAIADRVKDAAQASDLAYVDSRDTQFDDWQELGFDEEGLDADGLGLSQELFENNEEGYYAKLFKNTETGEYMIAFRGADDKADWRHNLDQNAGRESVQYKTAMDLATQAAVLVDPGSKLSFAGHSLGGGLASAASVVTGVSAVTFNSAGLNPKTTERYLETEALPETQQIDAFFVKGDVLSAVQDPFQDVLIKSAAGNRIPLNNTGFKSPLVRHGMDTVGDAIGIVLNRGGPGMGAPSLTGG